MHYGPVAPVLRVLRYYTCGSCAIISILLVYYGPVVLVLCVLRHYTCGTLPALGDHLHKPGKGLEIETYRDTQTERETKVILETGRPRCPLYCVPGQLI